MLAYSWVPSPAPHNKNRNNKNKWLMPVVLAIQGAEIKRIRV
jgi:hypothetical protein